MRVKVIVITLFISLIIGSYQSFACTRIMYAGNNGVVVSGRTMDWTDDVAPNIYVFPRGMERNGEAGENSITWKSKYGSVITSGYETFTTDGMNEKGLMFSLLYLKETSYEQPNDTRKSISVGAWGQYVLDNFATVDEAVNYLEKDNIRVNDKTNASLHFTLSDTEGNNAIIEYIEGKIKIYKGAEHKVLTNSPTYDIQLENQSKTNDSITDLKGGITSADRFRRASFYVNTLPKTDDALEGVMSVMGVLRTISTPIHSKFKEKEEPFYTVWRTVADQKNKIYYFEMVAKPNIFWLELDKLDFSEKANVMRLTLEDGSVYMGSAINNLIKSKPFNFVQ